MQTDVLQSCRGHRGTSREIADSVGIVRVNIGGAAATVEAAAACGIRRVLHLSSGSVYGASGRDVGLLTEDTPLRPEQLYGITKRPARQSRCGSPICIGRPFDAVLALFGDGICNHRAGYAECTVSVVQRPARSALPAILPRSHLRDCSMRGMQRPPCSSCYMPARVTIRSTIWRWVQMVDRGFLRPLQQVRSGFEWRFARHRRAGQHRYTRLMIALPWLSNACEPTRPFCTLQSSQSAG